jgi:hypothetical protein
MSTFSYKDWFNTTQRLDDFKNKSKELEKLWDDYFIFEHSASIAESISSNFKIFKQFDQTEIIPVNKTIVTKSVYEEYFYELHGAGALQNLYTSSVQQESFDYLTKCYIAPDITASVSYQFLNGFAPILVTDIKSKDEYRIFDIAYGNYYGSGSSDGTIITYDDATQNYDFSYPTKAVYHSLKQNTFSNENPTADKIEISGNVDSVFAINVSADYLYDGIANNRSFELKLAKMNGSSSINQLERQYKINLYASNNNTDPNLTRDLYYDREIYSFIELTKKATQISTPQLFDYIVSGSLIDGVHLKNNLPIIYGKIYYDTGIVILDADKLNNLLNLNLQTGSNVTSNNSKRLYKAVSASLQTYAILADGNPDITNPYYPDIQTTLLAQQLGTVTTPRFDIKQTINSIFYKCILGTEEFNYSTNPSYYDGKSGDLRVKAFYSGSTDFYVRPESYITSIGLYDSVYNLIAVAKLSRPQRKSFNNSIIINVRVDY